jgi:hypothetical protein
MVDCYLQLVINYMQLSIWLFLFFCEPSAAL